MSEEESSEYKIGDTDVTVTAAHDLNLLIFVEHFLFIAHLLWIVVVFLLVALFIGHFLLIVFGPVPVDLLVDIPHQHVLDFVFLDLNALDQAEPVVNHALMFDQQLVGEQLVQNPVVVYTLHLVVADVQRVLVQHAQWLQNKGHHVF
jgi:hypothetical protein